MNDVNVVYSGDCLELMNIIESKSIDLVLCDLPYGTTSCKWDVIIPFTELWKQYNRVAKDNAAIVLTAAQPFTTLLIHSNLDLFKYCWYWNKQSVTGFANAKKQPLREIEDVCVFYKKPPVYNPQGLKRLNKVCRNGKNVGGETLRGDIEESANKGELRTAGKEYVQEFTNYPRQTLHFARETGLHPTQKPVGLFKYFIKTYTNEGATVLDNCAGSGTTAIACIETNRNYIVFENDEVNYNKITKRIKDYKEAPTKRPTLF